MLIYIIIHNDIFFQKSLFYLGDDPLRAYNSFYYAVDNFSRFHLPLSAPEKNLGEPFSFYHLWLGVYSIQNFILGLLVKFLSLNHIPFKYLYLFFYRFFSNFFLTAGFYLVLKRFSKNRIVLLYSLFFLTLFGFYAKDLDYAPVTIFFGFFINAILDFFVDNPSKKKYFILITLTALMLHSNILDSATIYLCGITLISGILISYYFHRIEHSNIIDFFKNNKLFIFFSTAAAFLFCIPNLYIYFNYAGDFAMPRSLLSSASLSFDNVNFNFFNFMLPPNMTELYIGWFAVTVLILGISTDRKNKYSLICYAILIIPSTFFLLKNSSNFIYNALSYMIPNVKIQRWSGFFIYYSTILFSIPFCYYLDAILNEKKIFSTQKFKKILRIILLVLLFSYLTLVWIERFNYKMNLRVLKYALPYYAALTVLFYFAISPASSKKSAKTKIIICLILFIELCFTAYFKDDYPFAVLKHLPKTSSVVVSNNLFFQNRIFKIDNPKEHTEFYPEIYTFSDALIHKTFHFPVKNEMSISPYHNIKTKYAEALLNEKDYDFFQNHFNKKIIVFNPEKINFEDKRIRENFISPAVFQINSGRIENDNSLKISRINSDKFIFKSSFPANTNIFFNQMFDKRWNLKIDGKSADIKKIFKYFTGFTIPAGNHIVELQYADNCLSLIIWITLFFSSVFLLYLLYDCFVRIVILQNRVIGRTLALLDLS
ncbi:MAG TPA: YfhO family protein [bacterium]|nr:YfhO family protein [bacterium]